MNIRRKNILLSSVSFLILISGIILCDESVRIASITFLSSLFHLLLNVHFRSIGLYYTGTWMITASVILFFYVLSINGYLKQPHFYIFSSCLVIIHYFFHLSTIAENYPIYDDQGAILNFLLKFQNATSWEEKTGLIFLPYNESVMAVPRLFVLFWFKIFGEVNFRHLVFFNGILLVLLQVVFFYRYYKIWSPWLLIVTVFIFQFQFYDDAFWVISGLCYYNAFLFTAGSIYFLFKKDHRNNFLSATFALLATLTFGNGWILFPFAFLFLIRNKKFNLLPLWIVTFITAAYLFYSQRENFHPLTEVNTNLFENILFILVFLGSSLQFFYSPIIPIIGGIFIISTFVYIIFRKKQLTTSLPFLILGFIILSAITASPLRSSLDPYGQYGMRVRYGIFSIMAVVLCISLLDEVRIFNKRKIVIVAGAAFIYNLLTGLFFYPEPVIRKENIEIVIQGIRQNNFNIRYTTLNKNEVDNLFRESIAYGIYKP